MDDATPDERLGLAIKRVQYRDHRAADAALRSGAGLTLVQWDTLRAIERTPAASGHDLASATFQSDQSFSSLATRLVAAGWIERTRAAGRRIEHRLTGDGGRVLRAGHAVLEPVLRDRFAALDESERRTLTELLERLTA